MIADAYENIIKYIDRFDPDKFSNPHAYFTKITYYAFLRRIEDEKRMLQTKFEYEKLLNVTDQVSDRNPYDDDSYDDHIKHKMSTDTYVNHFLEDQEIRQQKKRDKNVKRKINSSSSGGTMD